MPVGNSDNGVGLWAGQIMFALDNTNQYIDWWHEALPGAEEGFDHEGTLLSTILVPKLTIGLSNYWNITISQSIGNRYMNWNGGETTIHHRDEGTHTSFLNAIGGYFGDTEIVGRYLFFNDGVGAGKRFFVGGGLKIPSKSTLTSDPFFLNGEQQKEHRHFSLSEGVYKTILEAQLFFKRDLNPVFFGGTFKAEIPIKDNSYGFTGSSLYSASFSSLTKEIKLIKGSLGLRSSLRYTTKAYWNGKEAPNSQAVIFTAGGGGVWGLKSGTLGVNISKPIFLVGAFSSIEGQQKQRVKTWQISFGFRKLFDFNIPFLDPFKRVD